MSNESILVIEDEKDLIEVIQYNFEREGFRVYSATNGERGLELAKEKNPAVILLDLMLPGVDGLEVARRLRKDPQTQGIAIIMLTAKSEESDVILGLGIGADDYITKPFRPKELLARVQAVLRRTHPTEDFVSAQRLERHGILIDTNKHQVIVKNEEILFTLTEFRLLLALALVPGRVFSREQLLQKVHGDVYLDERNIDVHVRAIRKKLGSLSDLVQTIRGVGYKFKE